MNRTSYYLIWLLVPTLLGLVSAHPELLLVALVALVAQRWLPDPYLYFKHYSRIRALEALLVTNPHNSEAQRDLVRIYLDKGQAVRALPVVTAALVRDPDSAELHYLHGAALLGAKRPAEALEPLGVAVARDPKLRYGDAYLRLGDALMALGRHEEAERAYDALIGINSSTVEGYVKLARARKARGDEPGAQRAYDEARATYRQLPGFLRRRDWSWAVRAFLGW